MSRSIRGEAATRTLHYLCALVEWWSFTRSPDVPMQSEAVGSGRRGDGDSFVGVRGNRGKYALGGPRFFFLLLFGPGIRSSPACVSMSGGGFFEGADMMSTVAVLGRIDHDPARRSNCGGTAHA